MPRLTIKKGVALDERMKEASAILTKRLRENSLYLSNGGLEKKRQNHVQARESRLEKSSAQEGEKRYLKKNILISWAMPKRAGRKGESKKDGGMKRGTKNGAVLKS